MEHLHHQNLQQHTAETHVLVLFTASNYWRRDLSAFDNMVLSAAAASRLPWRDGTISLSRLASNITVPTFSYNNVFIQSQKCSCILENKVCWAGISSMLPICLCRSSEASLEGNNNGFQLRFINGMCLNVWKCVGVSIIEDGSVLWISLWDLISKFLSTVVVITDFLYWKICISIFIYQLLIIWIDYHILHEIFTGFKSTRDKWLLFFSLSFGSLCRRGISHKKTMVDLFTTVSSIHITLQDMTTLWIRCSWFRLCFVT